MPIQEREVVAGGYFVTEGQQLRKVVSLDKDDKGRTRVTYMTKSARLPNRAFDFAATKANPALLETFAADCSARLDDAAIRQLRDKGILLEGE